MQPLPTGSVPPLRFVYGCTKTTSHVGNSAMKNHGILNTMTSMLNPSLLKMMGRVTRGTVTNVYRNYMIYYTMGGDAHDSFEQFS